MIEFLTSNTRTEEFGTDQNTGNPLLINRNTVTHTPRNTSKPQCVLLPLTNSVTSVAMNCPVRQNYVSLTDRLIEI
jgi:hypothetical protein